MDVILVDAKNATYRHGYTRALLRNSAGVPTGAIFGVFSCLIRLSRFYPNARFVFCWDGKETKKSWRHKMCKTYKANRHKPGSGKLPPEVVSILSQIPAIKAGLSILGFPQLEVSHLEADDLIGILSARFKEQKGIENVYIYSMDKDMYQLISKKVSVVRDLDKAKKCKAFKAKDVEKEFGVRPKDWVRFRSLIGDKSDGILPPFFKVGPVKALKLLAAGLDPANNLPSNKVEKEYAKDWSKCHMNFKLSKIITDASSTKLLSTDKLELKKLLKDLILVTKSSAKEERQRARAFVQFCAKFELNYILEQRHIFYKML